MTIGERIKYARESRGMNQVDLANSVHISKQTLYKYENNIITNIPSDKIEAISYTLDVSPAYIMGWEESPIATPYPAPTVTDDVVTFPVIGDVAAGYDHMAVEDWSGDTIQIPAAYLHGRPRSDYFVLNVHGDSMYPMYIEGDKVLVLKADTLERSGQIGVMLYNGDNATVKKIEYADGEDWLRMVPINPNYPPKTITGADLEQCRVIGIPKMLVREIQS